MSKFEEAKNKIILEAERKAMSYLSTKYGVTKLARESVVELTHKDGSISHTFDFTGKITCFADSGALLNPVVGVEMTVNSNDIEVESENIPTIINNALNTAKEHSDVVVASLDSFKLHDDGSKYLKLSHTALQDANLGIVGKNEWAASPDKSELLQGMVKDAMLENNISFVGEFKEPTIEKIASSVACPECGSDMSDLRDVCPKCEDESKSKKKAALIVEKQVAPRKSWLTADLDEPLGDVWNLETSDQEMASDELSNIAREALDGDTGMQEYLMNLWDNESWESIKKKLETEGSVWYVWWMDGVNKFMRDQSASNTESNLSIKEDMPMARATDHLAQAAQLEEQLISASSEKIKNEAANSLISMLQGMGYGSAKIAEITPSKDGLDFMAAIDDGGAVKAVSIPVVIKEAKVILPKKSLVSTLISKGLDVKAKLAEQFDLDLLEKLAAIDEKMAYETKEANDILADRPAAAVVKEAAGEKQPFFDSDDSTMTLNKHLLPDHEDYKVGDILSDGTDEYEIVNTSGQQNDKNEGSSSQWTLKKRQAPLRDDKEPKNKMPS